MEWFWVVCRGGGMEYVAYAFQASYHIGLSCNSLCNTMAATFHPQADLLGFERSLGEFTL